MEVPSSDLGSLLSASPQRPPLSPRSPAKVLVSVLTGRRNALSYPVTPRKEKSFIHGDLKRSLSSSDKNKKTFSVHVGGNDAVSSPSGSPFTIFGPKVSLPLENGFKKVPSSGELSMLEISKAVRDSPHLRKKKHQRSSSATVTRYFSDESKALEILGLDELPPDGCTCTCTDDQTSPIPTSDEVAPIESPSRKVLQEAVCMTLARPNFPVGPLIRSSSYCESPKNIPDSSYLPPSGLSRTPCSQCSSRSLSSSEKGSEGSPPPDEWVFCTLKKPKTNRRVAAMSRLTLEDNLEQYQQWLQDTPKSSKGHTKGRSSFRFGSGKTKGLSGSRVSTGSGKTVAVQGHSRLEDLEKKQEEVVRALKFHEDAVSKDIPDYLQGTATILLENIIYLSKDLEQVCQSPEAARLTSRMYQAVAELLKWSDKFHLKDTDLDSSQSKNLSHKVKEAVKELVEFAINKENQNIACPDYYGAPNKRESSSSLCSDESPRPDRRKLANARNPSVHGSLPEIPSLILSTSGNHSSLSSNDQLSPNSKLTHSLSSDSILDSKEGDDVVSYSHDSTDGSRNFGSNNSLDDAPPVPPKKHRNKPSRLAPNGFEDVSLRQISPIIPPLHDCGNFPRHSTGSTVSCSSTPHSLERASPATSQESVNRSLEDKLSYSSFCSSDPSSNILELIPCTSSGFSSLNYLGDASSLNQDISQLHLTSSASASPNYSSHSRSFFSQSCESTSFHQQKRTLVASATTQFSSLDASPQTQNYFASNTHQHHLVVHRSSRSSTCSSSTSSSRSSGVEGENSSIVVSVPPPIPIKNRNQICQVPDRAPSHYDNIPFGGPNHQESLECRHESPCRILQSNQFCHQLQKKQTLSIISSSDSGFSTIHSSPAGSINALGRFEENSTIFRDNREFIGEKPPLPLKKKRIMEYLELVKDYQGLPDRRSQQLITQHQCQLEIESTSKTRLSLPASSERPALPPKRKIRNREASPALYDLGQQEGPVQSIGALPPPHPAPPPPPHICSCSCMSSHDPRMVPSPPSPVQNRSPIHFRHPSSSEGYSSDGRLSETIYADEPPRSPTPSLSKETREAFEEAEEDSIILAITDVSEYIKFDTKSKRDSQHEEIIEGSPDSLLVFATYSKNDHYLDAFLTTYRTFLTPADILTKLIRRYEIFSAKVDPNSEKAIKNTYSLLVRVVHEFNVADDNEYKLLSKLSDFEYDLLSKGELRRALLLRKELTEKVNLKKRYTESPEFPGHAIIAKNAQQYSLLDFKTSELAEQMTLIEAELFEKVGISEALQWARAQNPEKCPNLCTFTNHFNNVSFWVRTLILQSSAHDRDKYLKKFIKIMKYFRKVNNFSSELAIWAAISSMCIERLGLQQSMHEELKEHETFFKPGYSSEYREALAEAKPPCLPSLGTILADLTSAHNGNSDLTLDGKVNFKKRWIQNKILKDFKRFNPCRYKFKKNETIVKFFNNFENYLDEEEQWKVSYKIKPK